MTVRRFAVLLVAIAFLVALIVLDSARQPEDSAARLEVAAIAPSVNDAGALGSTFFCPAGTATGDGSFESTIVVTNLADGPTEVTITAVPGAADGHEEEAAAVAGVEAATEVLTVGAKAQATLALSSIIKAPYASALVESSQGEVAVEQRTSGPQGVDSGPCASSASSSWYFPAGTTTKDAKEVLALFNPFPGDAVVDLTFDTSDGRRSPSKYQSYVIPGRQLRVVNVGDELQRHELVSTAVEASAGRLVVGRMQLFDGSEPGRPAGMAATVGAPATAEGWIFAEGQVREGVDEYVTVFNPSAQEAVVDVEVLFDEPSVNGVTEPIEVSVQAGSSVRLAMQDQTRVAPELGHSLVVRSSNGVPIVAERSLTSSSPATKTGYATSMGSAVLSDRWVFADGRADGEVVEVLAFINVTAAPVKVTATVLAQGRDLPVDGLRDFELAPNTRVLLDLGTRINRVDLPLLIEGDGPFAVQRGLYQVNRRGISVSDGLVVGEVTSVASVPSTAWEGFDDLEPITVDDDDDAPDAELPGGDDAPSGG